MTDRQERLTKANDLLACIAGCGRRFFEGPDQIARFELGAHNRLYYVDKYPSKRQRIYMGIARRHFQRGFTEGGTLKELIWSLRGFIMTGKKIPRGHFFYPDWYSNGDPWGYGADMKTVRTKAVELAITAGSFDEEEGLR